MESRRLTVILHLLGSWFLYNSCLLFVLLVTCECFDENELETLAAMAIFSAGIAAMQYDLWTVRRERFKVNDL